MTYARVNDISFWQDRADFERLKTLSQGVILRAGQGSWRDSKFATFRKDAKAAGIPFGNYFYYDNSYQPKRQAEKWAEVIDGDEGILGCWLDLEDTTPGEYGEYKDWWDCIAYFKQIKPEAVVGIYTRAEYFNSRAPANHAFRNLPLWIAHYKTDKPALPKGWDTWLFWQYSAEGDGVAHGVGSKEIDMNYFNGTVEDFRARYGLGNSPDRLTANFGQRQVIYQEQK